MPHTRLLLLFLTLFANYQTTVSAQSYYVCQSCGNDGNPGTLNAPWKTIGRACQSGAVQPGSTVYIRAGTYPENITVSVSGTANQPITFRPYNTEVVRVDGGNAAGILLKIRSQSYLTIDNLIFQNAIGSGSNGIEISGNARNITVKNCTITNIKFDASLTKPTDSSRHNAHGILVQGDDPNTAITNLLIQGNALNQIVPGYSEGMTIVGNVDGFEVLDNTINNVANIGLVIAGYYTWACQDCPKTSTTQNQARHGTVARNQVVSCRGPLAFAAGIYADGSRDIVIEGNLVRDCQRGFQINCENPSSISGATATNIIIRNNLAYQNSRAGIGLGSNNSTVSKVVSCSIVSNSCYDNYIDRSEAGTSTNEDFGEITLGYSENCVVGNNSFHAGSRQRLLNSYVPENTPRSINLKFNYNLWFTTNSTPFWVLFSTVYYGFPAFRSGTGQETNGVFGDPQYTNITTVPLNLMIKSTSVAINIGDPSSTTALVGGVDYALKPRFRAGRVDAGAFEFPKPVISVGTGSWHVPGIWDCSCVPTRFDSVQIQSGHTVSINGVNGQAQAQQIWLLGRLQFLSNGQLRIFSP